MTLKTAHLLHWSSLMSYVLFIANTSKVDELLRITTFKLQEIAKEYFFSSPGSNGLIYLTCSQSLPTQLHPHLSLVA